jgi:CBS domain-containing protein
MKVKDIMSRDVVTIAPDTPVIDAVRLLIKHGRSGLPVVDKENKLVGFLPGRALLTRGKYKKLGHDACPAGVHLDPAQFVEFQRKVHGTTAEDLMIEKPVSIEESADLSEAVDLMLDTSIHRLPVVRRGKVVGYLTRIDVLKVLLEQELKAAPRAKAVTDDDMKREIHDCLRKILGISMMNIKISVEQGVVHLHGTVSDGGDVTRIESVVRSLQGVKDVRNELLIDRMLT